MAASTLSVGSPNVPPLAVKKLLAEEISTMPVARSQKLSDSVVVADVFPSKFAKAPDAPMTAAFVESACSK